MDERIRRLVNLEGEYWFGDAVYGLDVKERTLDEIAAADTVGIRGLVACLSDTRRTRVTLRGERVAVGALCAEALVSTAYFQTGLKHRAFTADWPGMPPLTTDDSLALGRVQRAWFQWLHEHPLVWPPVPPAAQPCPSGDAIRPERFRDSLATDGTQRTYMRIGETLNAYRYLTHIIDSEFVILSDAHPRTASDSLRAGLLEGLDGGDVVSIDIRRSANEAWKWRACEGIPVVLITTKSRSWRPRTSR